MSHPTGSNELTLRLADASDRAAVFEWRNDATSRRMSLDGDPVEWDAHCTWYDASLRSDDRLLLIGEVAAGRVGVVRFDFRAEECVVSINLNPSFRGRGLAGPLLAASIEHAARERKARVFVARIKPENEASQRIFGRCGFVMTGSADGHDDYRLERAPTG
jgi:RimJ/RimL family protein N-acetyltransferase